MSVWKFAVKGDQVTHGRTQRRKITRDGCNEPFKGRYWCPKAQWFKREPCPFINRHECKNFDLMCGSRCG